MYGVDGVTIGEMEGAEVTGKAVVGDCFVGEADGVTSAIVGGTEDGPSVDEEMGEAGMGEEVGRNVGDAVGPGVGETVGPFVGEVVGDAVRPVLSVGEVGPAVGYPMGETVDAAVEERVGELVGPAVVGVVLSVMRIAQSEPLLLGALPREIEEPPGTEVTDPSCRLPPFRGSNHCTAKVEPAGRLILVVPPFWR